jgi:YfiH family protein
MDVKSWYRADLGEVIVHKAWNLERTGLVMHGFSTRRGGVSDSPCDTLNPAFHVDDDPNCVLENRRRLMLASGLNPTSMTCAEQVHGSSIAVITADDAGHGAMRFEDSAPGVDALITSVPGPVISLFFADCVPVFILDPIEKAIGLAHAGWKGTALSIASETMLAMQREFGSNPSDCLAAVGPAIGRCCYDVSMDVAEKVVSAAGDDRVLARASQDHMRLDLKLANWFILRRAGIPEKNIALSNLCTACDADDFFSYRRDGATGRMCAFMALQE